MGGICDTNREIPYEIKDLDNRIVDCNPNDLQTNETITNAKSLPILTDNYTPVQEDENFNDNNNKSVFVEPEEDQRISPEELLNSYLKKYSNSLQNKQEESIPAFSYDNYNTYEIPDITIISLNNTENITFNQFSIDNQEIVYSGFLNNFKEKHGKGMLIKPNGEKYIGYFKNNEFSVFGRLYTVDGVIKEGAFEKGKLNGKGMVIKENQKYFGNFVDDEKNGFGKDVNTKEEYEGYFRNNKKEGKGKIIFNNTNNCYEGDFLNGKMTGNGIYRWKNGDTYVGSILNGVIHGSGKYTWNEGNEYEGEYFNGIRQGLGILRWNDGRVYKGQFFNNKPHGNGVIISNGIETAIKFNEGKVTSVENF